ncbi:mannitol dehydrogenase domain protein [Gloeophyllum trabeum ATCC 11539]|uniref:Mannitol-1-phosphate 5-dehydrogenase n=1 Tax=Gloeophyllum trabeum (strain ATCC 11539 / FP-39264 / Madison 617) TaxID=670483 RepID=S7PR87_GLOTA|nr:mannitol dehydrogenase domain protein [Gloeophyllum trabeum ATCC 11539]EPQ50361.1 mannitol dehydrogenase domain protein [Gloeophyllum trabeum ATCC 11539]
MPHKKAIHFGAGNIGRGFIGPLLVQSGYHVVFADVDAHIIDELNTKHSYQVHILDNASAAALDDGQEKKKQRRESVDSVSGVLTTHMDDVIKEFEDPAMQIVTTAVGPPVLAKIAPAIAQGLQGRRRAIGERGVLNVIACENMVNQTTLLKDLVMQHLPDDDRAWADAHVGWANCSVDRIVPPADGLDGSNNPLDVGVEDFYEWVVDERALKRDDDVHMPLAGMKLTQDLEGYIHRKLFTLNCGHAITAYLGYLKGYRTVDQAIRDPQIRDIVKGALEESGFALIRRHGFDEEEHREYIEKTLTRFENPNLKDDVNRVGRQPLRKLGREDRLLGPVYMAKEYQIPVSDLLRGIAAAFLYDIKDDPQSVELRQKIKDKGITKTVEEITGFEEGSPEHEIILKSYEELSKWRQPN